MTDTPMTEQESQPDAPTAKDIAPTDNLTAEEIHNLKIAKLVIDIDKLCEVSNVKVNQALAAMARLAAIKLAEQPNRVLENIFNKFLAVEIKDRRRDKIQRDEAQKKALINAKL